MLTKVEERLNIDFLQNFKHVLNINAIAPTNANQETFNLFQEAKINIHFSCAELQWFNRK